MSYRWDLATYDVNNQLVLIVEVKSKLGVSLEWADEFRRNIFSHAPFQNVPFFLMVFPDQFYLWKDNKLNSEPCKPKRIDASPILQPYFERSGIKDNRVSHASLELIVASWLNEIIYTPPDKIDASQKWLIETGLYNAVAKGSIAQEVLT